MRLPDPIANTTTEAYLAYKAGVLEVGDLKPSLYNPYLHFDAWLAYWAGLTGSYPVKGLGKNLLPFMAQSFSINGVTFSYQNGSLYLNGTSTGIIASNRAEFKNNLAFTLPAGTYTVSKSGGTIGGSIRDYSTGNAIAAFDNNHPKTTFTLAESTKAYLGIYVDANRTFSDFEPKVQLEQGSSASSYEPYTGEPEMLCDEEALVAYLAGVTNTYPEEIKDPYDVRIVGYLKYLVSARWGRPEYPVTNEELYLSMMDAPIIPSGDPSSDIEIDGTAEAPFASLEVYGDTYQQTYSGKNLMPLSSVSVDNNTRETKFKIDLPAGTYTISFDIDSFSLGTNTSFGMSMSFVNSSNIQFADMTIITLNSSTTLGRKTYNFTITDDASSAYGSNIRVPLTQYNNGARVEISNIQIEQGSATSFEPYVGGTPAPNPDYPQDVQVVTGEQTVTVTGKNLFDMNTELGRSNVASTTITGSTIKIENTATGNAYRSFLIPNSAELLGKTCTISFGQVNTHNHIAGAFGRFAIHQTNTSAGYYANNTIVSATNITSNYNYTFTFPDSFASGQNGILLLLYVSQFGVNNQTGDHAEFSNVQIELGSTPSSYEPYVASQSYTVDLGSIELCKIGDYQDYIYKSGEDWYVHKGCSKIIYDGSEDESWTYANGSIFPFRMEIAAAANLTSSQALPPNMFSNYYTPRKWNYNAQTEVLPDACITATVSKTFAIRNVDIETLADFKTWLSSHNLINYYQLATPTDTKITDAGLIGQLEALKEGGSYNGKTYIKVTATDPNLPALLKVEAYKYD